MGCEMAPMWSGRSQKVMDFAPVPKGQGPGAPSRMRIGWRGWR